MSNKEVFSTSNAEEMAVAIGDNKSLLPGSSIDGLQIAKTARATYDFDVDGGAIGAIGLGVKLPPNAIVKSSFIDVIKTCTSGTDAATIAIDSEGAGDVVAAVAISVGTPWDAGLQTAIQNGGLKANMVKTTAEKELTATVAVEALTAGKFHVYVEYVISDNG